jgi:hypothetical protein
MKLVLIFLIISVNVLAQNNLFSGKKMILDQEATLYYNSPLINNRSITVQSKRNTDNRGTLTQVTLAPNNTSRNSFIKKVWSNFGIHGEFNFDLVVDNRHLTNLEDNSLSIPFDSKQHYFFECRNKNKDILGEANSYLPEKNKLDIANYEHLANKNMPIFNYDFIVEKESIYLLIQQVESIYIYQINDISELPNPKWNLLHCIKSPFSHEYFIITKNAYEGYVIHTQTQGEYKFKNFTTKPEILKRNDKNLENRIFVEDKRTNRSYEFSHEECNSLINSENYFSKLTSILEEKTK